MNRFETHLIVDSSGVPPADLLHRETGLSKQSIKTAMTQGAVWLTRGRNTQRLRRAKRSLKIGDKLHLYYDEAILAEVPAEPALVADKGRYTVWNKPYGMRSQGSKWGDHCTVARWAERHLEPERPAFTVHRLDRAARGLIVVAHTKRIAAALSTLFQRREIEKRYRALVKGDFSAQPNLLRVDACIDNKVAISEFALKERFDDDNRSLVDVRIETGRKHQIRRHLAELGYPIVGDRLYGTGKADGLDLQLNAYRLAFHCPVDDLPVEFELDV